ncbi:prenyltransferase [archaeon]|nr:MAG: prenyltransferase [archaeon]
MEATVMWKAYMDLTRAHFSIVWPLLICAGTALATLTYGTANMTHYLHIGGIGLLGFLAGLVLNDIVDNTYDRDEPDESLTRYWRPFKERPLVTGSISVPAATAFFVCLVVATTCLVVLLPFPHNVYILAIMGYAYAAEFFYQTKKRDQSLPLAQLVGRTDLALFPVAGYLSIGGPDFTAAFLFGFMYTWAQIHLAINDLADTQNDITRHMYTIPVLYGEEGAIRWIAMFTLLHAASAGLFIPLVPTTSVVVGAGAFLLFLLAIRCVVRHRGTSGGLRALPLLHASLLMYTIAFIAGAVL